MTAYKILAELDVTSIDDTKLVTRLMYDFSHRYHKETFDSNERLRVIRGDHDYSIDDQPYGQKLADYNKNPAIDPLNQKIVEL